MSARVIVRRLQVLGSSGKCGDTSNVFCPRQLRTTDLTRCRACPWLVRAAEDSIDCEVERDEGLAGEAVDCRLGGDTCVGDVMGRTTVCALADLAAPVLARYLKEQGSAFAVVVKAPSRFVGLVDREAAGLASDGVPVSDLTRYVAPVSEGAPLASAVERMVRERLRVLPVVNDEGSPVALLSDIDALQWVASRSRLERRAWNGAARPPPTPRAPVQPGEGPMTPSEIRKELLSQHAQIRVLMEATCAAARVARSGSRAVEDPRASLLRLADALRAHNLREEALLKELDLSADAWADARAAIMTEEHVQEHARLCEALLEVPYSPVGMDVGPIVAVINRIREHMDREEDVFLNDGVLRDDIVVTDQSDG